MPQSDLMKTVQAVDGTVKRLRSNKRVAYELTQLGKIKAEEVGLGGAEWEVLSYINDHGPSPKQEISAETHMAEQKVKVILGRLQASGYVKPIARSD